MPYRDFTLRGEELIEEWGHASPVRMNRLISVLEDFVCGGPATRLAPRGSADAEVYLVPPRSILRVASDAAALLLVDHRQRTVEIVEIIHNYVETSQQNWLDLVERAERTLEDRR